MRDNQIVTHGIVLSRTDYQEADKIVTFLTLDNGKVRTIAKGVRKNKSRLAGGVELFSVSELTFLKGRGDLTTLISARLITYYSKIVQNLDRTQWGYETLRIMNRLVEDVGGEEYFQLLQDTLAALDNLKLALPIVELWFDMQLLRSLGNEPNLTTDRDGEKLDATQTYGFDLEAMTFFARDGGEYTADHIKILRLSLSNSPEVLQQVGNIATLLDPALQLAHAMRQNTLRV